MTAAADSGIGGEGFAETVFDVWAGDVYFDEVGLGAGDATGDIAEFGGGSGKDAGDDRDIARLQPRFGLLQQPDFLFHARVRQTDRVEQAATPVDAGRVDVAMARFGAAAFGCDGTAAFGGCSFEQADGRAPNSACQDKRRGQFAVEKVDWQMGMFVTQFGSPITLRNRLLCAFP